MAYSLDRARSFLAGHGRLLDRRRFELLAGDGDPTAVIAAVDGYRNPDGGYGWGIEPDLRDGTSQVAGALHALEVFAEAPQAVSGQAGALLDWLAGHTLPDGGLPFALPVAEDTGVAPCWAQAASGTSSLHITTAVGAHAHLLADRLPDLAGHPWLATASGYCLRGIAELAEPSAHELSYAIQFLDAAADREPGAAALLDRLAALLPADGLLRVAGGAADEALRPLDYAPWPQRPARRLVRAGVIEAELARLAAGQQRDGGWLVDFGSYSPAARLEWRGYATVRAVAVLLANQVGRAAG